MRTQGCKDWNDYAERQEWENAKHECLEVWYQVWEAAFAAAFGI